MATKGFTAAGGTFGIDVTNGNSYVTIGQIKTLSPTAPKWSFEDITNLGSPQVGSGVLKEQQSTVLDPGSIAGTAIYLPSDPGFQALRLSSQAGNLAAFSMQLPLDKVGGQSTSGDKYTFSGYVTDFPVPDTLDATKVNTYRFTVQVNSITTYVQGS